MHVEIGRVILGRYDLKPKEVRAAIAKLGIVRSKGKLSDTMPARWDAAIQNFICQSCNEDWANKLEREAAKNLRGLYDGEGRARADLLRRWAWFFMVKVWWAYERTDSLRVGWLRQPLSLIRDPNQETAFRLRVHVGRIVGGPPMRFWASCELRPQATSGLITGYVTWVIRDIMWIVGAPDENDDAIIPGVPSRPLVSRLRLSRFPEIDVRQAAPWFLDPPPLPLV